MNAAAPPRAAHRANTPVSVVVSVALTALVLVFLLPNLWYQLHDVSDIPVYQAYSQRMADGERPFTKAFEVEYPPLAIPIFRLPGHAQDPDAYVHWFSISSSMRAATRSRRFLNAVVSCAEECNMGGPPCLWT